MPKYSAKNIEKLVFKVTCGFMQKYILKTNA